MSRTKIGRGTDLSPEELAAVIAAARDARNVDPIELRRRQRQRRLRYRLRRQARPHYVVVALLVIAAAAQLAVRLGASAAIVTGTLAAVAATGVMVGVLVRRRTARRRGRRWLCAGIAGVCWLTWTTAFGLSWETVAVLLLGGYGFALRWWRRHRIPNPEAVPLDAPDTDFTVPALWQANVSCGSGALPGSYLTDHREIRHGEQFAGQLRPGRQSIDNARAALPLIASGLRQDTDRVVIDRHPTGDASRFRLSVVTRSPIAKPVMYPGPQYDPVTGMVALGPWADGEGFARWRIYSENSMWGGVLIGGPGSGKSRMTDNLAISAVASGHTVLLYGDPQHGASSRNLARYATWAARGTGEIATLVHAMWRVCDLRAKENALLGLEGFTPSPGRPGILAIIDEFHRVAADRDLATHLEYIAREGRKLGVAIIALSQYPGIVTFGGSEALRSTIMAGNAVALYVASNTSGGLMAGLDFNPSKLPDDRPGSAYLKGQDRSAPFRGFLVEEPAYWWEQVSQPPLDSVVLRAFGADFIDRQDRDAATRVALHAEVYGGRPVAPTPPVRPSQEQVGELIEFPPGLTRTGELTEAQARILAAIGEGHETPADIRGSTGYGETHVRQRLKELVASGHITKTTRGRYAVREPAEREASA